MSGWCVGHAHAHMHTHAHAHAGCWRWLFWGPARQPSHTRTRQAPPLLFSPACLRQLSARPPEGARPSTWATRLGSCAMRWMDGCACLRRATTARREQKMTQVSRHLGHATWVMCPRTGRPRPSSHRVVASPGQSTPVLCTAPREAAHSCAGVSRLRSWRAASLQGCARHDPHEGESGRWAD